MEISYGLSMKTESTSSEEKNEKIIFTLHFPFCSIYSGQTIIHCNTGINQKRKDYYDNSGSNNCSPLSTCLH